MKTRFLLIALSLIAGAGSLAMAEDHKAPRKQMWPFSGPFGHVDRQSAQRGFQVYKEVCASCHALNGVAFRNMAELDFSEGEVKALAAGYQVADGPNDAGDMFQRPGKPSDYFPQPYANENAARATNNGALPPDLGLIVKARHDGADYVYALLTGFTAPPEGVKMSDGQYYNPHFPGGLLMMPPPLSEGQVTYEDGTAASVDQMARDVVVFLQWAAEPEMEARKQMGIKAMIFLAIFTAFMYVAKRRVWSKLH